MAYALASLSCALPIFLAAVGIIVGAGLSTGKTLEIILGTISYSFGMGFVMTGITMGALLFEEALSRLIADVLKWMNIVGKFAILPIVGRKIKIIADEYADPDQGSGAVKITPAHAVSYTHLTLPTNREV